MAQSRWFSRDWTLQELIAPRTVEFLSSEWVAYGDKNSLAATLSAITRVDLNVLGRQRPLFEVPPE
jgi:hypothetical protein